MHGIQRYPRNAHEAAFLSGGIGTGNVPAGARGEIPDGEIINRPGKGNYLPFASSVFRASGHHVPPVTPIPESELAGGSDEPYALTSPAQTLDRREHWLRAGLAEVNVNRIARRS